MVVSSSRWKVTAPALRVPSGEVHATRSSGICSPASASHHAWLPELGHPVEVGVVGLGDRLDAFHEPGNSSNWVHWS